MRRDLVQRAMAHDHEAFSELARLSIDKLYAIARLILRDTDRAEDATQEALVLAWRDIAALRDPDRFEVWLRRLLVNACYREAAPGRERAGAWRSDVDPIEPATPDASGTIADRDELERGFRRLDARAAGADRAPLPPRPAAAGDRRRPRASARDRQVPAPPHDPGPARDARRRRARRPLSRECAA